MPQRNQRTRRAPQNVLHFEARRVTGSIDPLPVQQSILLQQRVQLQAVLANGKTTAITAAAICSQLPGGAASWDRFRILKVEVWGGDNAAPLAPGSLDLTVGLTSVVAGTDTAYFTDVGTTGARRAHLCISPSSLYQMSWNRSADTTALITISTFVVPATETDTVYVQVSIEARSDLIEKVVIQPPAD